MKDSWKILSVMQKGRSLSLMAFSLLLASTLNAGNVVTDWNAIASTTIVTNGGNGPASSGVWFAYTSLAMYDAVNAITGQYQPFYGRNLQLPSASIDAAAAVAAHRILVYYFPAQQTSLDAQLLTSLSAVNATNIAKVEGVAVGESAALAVINARRGDGLLANVVYTPGTGPGKWAPTPPAYAPPVTPWLGQMRPFTMNAANEFLPDGPTPLSSEAWARDYNLTRLYGRVDSTTRSANESEIGLFWTENTAAQYARAFNYLAANYSLGTADSARLLAMLWTGLADAGIGCYNAKYTYGFWRPVTAIPDGGGNPGLTADPSWLPLAATPAHPEYPAAHGCLTGAVTSLVANYFGTTKVHVVMDSKAFGATVHTHTFEDTRYWMDEVFWARMYAGFHFYHSLEDGRQLGQTVANNLLHSYFLARKER